MNKFKINKKKLRAGMIFIFFMSLIIISVIVNMKRVSVLVLHSYNTDYIWTRDINEGLQRVLGNLGGVSIQYHYMNTKNKSGKDNLRRSGIAARNAISNIQPTVLIAFDDYAQQLAAKHFVNDANINIVFGGVNGSIKPYGYDKANNVTGILERKPLSAIKDLILDINSLQNNASNHPIRTFFIADNSLSAKKDGKQLIDHNWSPLIFKGVKFCKTFAEWQQKVLDFHPYVDYFLVGPYRKLKRSAQNPELVPASEVLRWTSKHSPIPVIGMNVFNTNDGATLSVGVSPYEQGEVVAHMALDIINGKNPADIAVQTSQLYVVSMRNSAMQHFNLKVSKIYEAFSRATNNYYEQ